MLSYVSCIDGYRVVQVFQCLLDSPAMFGYNNEELCTRPGRPVSRTLIGINEIGKS